MEPPRRSAVDPGERAPAEADPVRGGRLVASVRAEPRSFNRLVARDLVSEVIALLDPRPAGAGQPRHPAGRAVAGRTVDDVARRPHLHPDSSSRACAGRTGRRSARPTSPSRCRRRTALFAKSRAGHFPDRGRQADRRRDAGRGHGRRHPAAAVRSGHPAARQPRHPAQAPAGSGAGGRATSRRPGRSRPRRPRSSAWDRSGWPAYEPGQRLTFERNPHYWRRDDGGRAAAVPRRRGARDRPRPERRTGAAAVRGDRHDPAAPAGRGLRAGPRLRGQGRAVAARSSASGSIPMCSSSTSGQGTGPRTRAARGCPGPSSGGRSRMPSIARPTPTPCSSAPPCRCTARSPRATRTGSGPTSRATASTGPPRRACSKGWAWPTATPTRGLEDAAGTEARFTLLTYRGNTALERGAQVLKESFEPIGVAVDIVALEPGALVERMLNGQLRRHLLQPALDRHRSGDAARLLAQLRAARTSGTSGRSRRPPTGSAASTS